MSGDLVAFVAARLDEDEAAAGVRDAKMSDPAREVREVVTGRAILELHSGAHECPAYDRNGDIDNCAWWPEGDCTTLRLRATVYSGHPDYRPEWAPQ